METPTITSKYDFETEIKTKHTEYVKALEVLFDLDSRFPIDDETLIEFKNYVAGLLKELTGMQDKYMSIFGRKIVII